MPIKASIIPVTAFQQNCSLIWCEETKDAAVVDPGGDLALIEKAVEEAGVNLTQILLTHGHIDHAGGTAELAEKRDLPIIGPQEDEKFWIDQLEDQATMFNFTPSKSFEPTRWLNDDDEVKVGNVALKVVHCPGHTPGHVVFISEEDKLAIVGDVLFQGSIGRTDFPKGNHEDLINSITQKLWPFGDDIVFIPGHGQLSTFGDERKTNPFVSDRALAG
ncbi:MBL fold metallo-hydrolase [Curvivirga aplysinae]|uniref:MBL fold metallo-hydrolase n=1 Tax=Curvivirga aplysinae TaxID=2529852 RepID=UPI0012BD637E|nr:MBL fold metallo-hydrolase [Curvivirga aplysinae]MTI08866.1 MBL fold metallo-hydrolase [Curvivirga aplysinae]